MHRIYLDSCATTFLGEAARQALSEALDCAWANPASQHADGRRARRRLEELKDRMGVALGLRPPGRPSARLLLTSGGTESNNLALLGLTGGTPGERVIISRLEHPSLQRAADFLEQGGMEVQRIPATPAGVIDLDQLQHWLKRPARLVSVMMVNHETGAVQPVAEIASLCRQAGALLHVDAVQALGKVPLRFADLDVDALTVTSHKLHGPVGIGALALRPSAPLQPQMWGGFQQGGLRPGTENPALAAGFAAALDQAVADDLHGAALLEKHRDALEEDLLGRLPDIVINAQQALRAPHVSNVSFLGLDRQALLIALDQAGVSCSTGSACASGSSEPSPVLRAMHLPSEVVDSALRFSVNQANTADEIGEAARRIVEVVRRLRDAGAR